MNLMSDTMLAFALVMTVLFSYYLLSGNEIICARNFLVMFVGGLFMTGCWLVGSNCSVKGIAGPTIAIIYTSCFYTTLLQVIF